MLYYNHKYIIKTSVAIQKVDVSIFFIEPIQMKGFLIR